MSTPTDLADRIEVVKRRDAFERDPQGFVERWHAEDEKVRRRILKARERVADVSVPDAILERAAKLCIALGTDGLRGELTLMRAARALAALDGDAVVGDAHLRRIAPSALRHRFAARPARRHRLGGARRARRRRADAGLRARVVPQASGVGATAGGPAPRRAAAGAADPAGDADAGPSAAELATLRWIDALRAAALLAVDPWGFGGVALAAAHGPVRERWLTVLKSLLPERVAMATRADPRRRRPLLGGLDLTATLAAGRPVGQAGLLAEADGGVLLLAMAERVGASTAARLCAALDSGECAVAREGLAAARPARFGVVALDEGAGDDPPPAAALLERLAFRLDLADVPLAVATAFDGDGDGDVPDRASVAAARARSAPSPSTTRCCARCAPPPPHSASTRRVRR